MPDISAVAGELRMTLQITRAATGEVETIDLVGKPIVEQEEAE